MSAKIDREFRDTDSERHKLKLHSVRKLAEKEAREGPVDPAYVRGQAAAWEAQAQEEARAAEQAREAARAGTVAAGVARSDWAGPGQPRTRHVCHCRQSRSRTANGREKGAGWGWKDNKDTSPVM